MPSPPAKAGARNHGRCLLREAVEQRFTQQAPGVWVLAFARTTVERCYCASARIPPAKACQAGVRLIGQFRSFTATSARIML